MSRKPFYLYHVTSSEYIRSIKLFGLGAIDPNKEFYLLKLLEELFIICEKIVPNDEYVITFREVTQAMILQLNPEIINPFTVSIQQENLSHGAVYLNTVEVNAVKFAFYNPYGSEILNRVIMYVRILDKYQIPFNYNLYQNKIFDLLALKNTKPKIYLLKFNYYDGLSLELEDRFDKPEREKEFFNVELFNKNIDNQEFMCNFRFKTNDIIDSKLIKFFELRISRDNNNLDDYSLI